MEILRRIWNRLTGRRAAQPEPPPAPTIHQLRRAYIDELRAAKPDPERIAAAREALKDAAARR